MQLENKGAPPKGGRYLACSDAARRAGCGNTRRWWLETVEANVLRALRHANLPCFADEDLSGFDGAAVALETDLADMQARR